MEVWKTARWKTAKIHWNEHTPGIYCLHFIKLGEQGAEQELGE